MLRAMTAAVLTLATLVCLVVIAFLLQVATKSGGGDIVALGMLLAFAAAVAGMWFCFSRRWHIAACILAIIPVALIIVFLSTFQLRMF